MHKIEFSPMNLEHLSYVRWLRLVPHLVALERKSGRNMVFHPQQSTQYIKPDIQKSSTSFIYFTCAETYFSNQVDRIPDIEVLERAKAESVFSD